MTTLTHQPAPVAASDPRTIDILSALPDNEIWNGQPVAFNPTRPITCIDGTLSSTVADLTGPAARAAQAELDEFQRDHCAQCPALIECAAHALVNEPYGMWGLTEEQRYGLGGVLPEEWPEVKVSPLDALNSITSNGITLDDVREILAEANRLRARQEQSRPRQQAA